MMKIVMHKSVNCNMVYPHVMWALAIFLLLAINTTAE